MTMKKLFALVVLSLFIMSGIALAEQGATSFSGKNYIEQGVYVDCYNGEAGTISPNQVVYLDTSLYGAAGTSFTACGGTIAPGDPRIVSGSAVQTFLGGTLNSPLIFGVSDSQIASSSVGRICIRGPHLVQVSTAPTLNALYSSGWMTGKADYNIILGGTIQGYVGICINTTTTATLAGIGNGACLMWVQPQRNY
jgi:hypothetical protein